MTAQDALRGVRFRFNSEAGLQGAMESVLRLAGVQFEREVVLAPGERIDFLCAD